MLRVQVENHAVDLVQREADIALRLFQPVQPDLIARRVANVRFGLFAAPAYLERFGVPRTVGDLADHRMIGGEGTPDVLGALGRQMATLPALSVVYRTNSPVAMVRAVAAGMGIAALSVRMGQGAGADLVRILADTVVSEAGLWLVTHADVHSSARIRVTADVLAEALTAYAPRFAGVSEDPPDRAPPVADD